MPTIYLDHNVIADIAGIPGVQDAKQQQGHAFRLKADGYRFALSAWNMYELARSNDDRHVDQCCDFVEALSPLWVNDTLLVKRQEVDRFLQPIFDNVGPVRNRTPKPFSDTVEEMWASYGIASGPHVSFRGAVGALRVDPQSMLHVRKWSEQVVASIHAGRQARVFGVLPFFQADIEISYLKTLLPAGDPKIQKNYLDYLLKNQKKLLAVSPATAVEDEMTHLHRKDSFTPEPGDAPDMQHAIVGLAYCDHFVTADKQLAAHCEIVLKARKLGCHIHRKISQI